MNQARRFPEPINFRDLTAPTHGLERSYSRVKTGGIGLTGRGEFV